MGSVSEICHGSVIDIGGGSMMHDVRQRLIDTITSKHGEKQTLPDEILYDDNGIQIWSRVVKHPQYYQATDEIALFKKNGKEIAELIRDSGVETLIDIGAGSTEKVEHLLSKVEEGGSAVTYLALDLSKSSLKSGIDYLVKRHPGPESKVVCTGLWGTFQDGQRYVRENATITPRLYISCGSILCNDEESTAIEFLKSWRADMRDGDRMLIGMDGHTAKDKDQRVKIWNSYHPDSDPYKEFFKNGCQKLNKILGENIFNSENWELKAELEMEPSTRHRNWMVAKKDIICKTAGTVIKAGHEFDWFDSHKHGEAKVREMCSAAGLKVEKVWKAEGSEFYQYWIERDCSKA